MVKRGHTTTKIREGGGAGAGPPENVGAPSVGRSVAVHLAQRHGGGGVLLVQADEDPDLEERVEEDGHDGHKDLERLVLNAVQLLQQAQETSELQRVSGWWWVGVGGWWVGGGGSWFGSGR